MLRALSRQDTFRTPEQERDVCATAEMKRKKTHKAKGKRGYHMSVMLPKVLHSFGKAPVIKFRARNLAMVCGEEKAMKAGASLKVYKNLSKNPGTPILQDYAQDSVQTRDIQSTRVKERDVCTTTES